MKKILVPTDFTHSSLNAYEYALRLAEVLGARVTLFHVYGFSEEEGHRPQSLSEALDLGDEEAALNALEGYGYAVQQGLGLEVPSHYILEKGKPVKAIVDYADFMEADLIVMSTWWAGGTGKMIDTWLGNSATKVIEKTQRPVLMVPEKVKYQGLHHIAYATNLKEKEQRVPGELIGLSGALALRVSVVHVRRPEDSYDPISFAFLREMYRLELDNFSIMYYTINDRDVVAGLNKFIENEAVDILAVLNHKNLTVFERLLGPKIPKQMAFHSRVPLLVMDQEFLVE
jgi:nucleotide-binding universal stress UspA family protein